MWLPNLFTKLFPLCFLLSPAKVGVLRYFRLGGTRFAALCPDLLQFVLGETIPGPGRKLVLGAPSVSTCKLQVGLFVEVTFTCSGYCHLGS